MELFKGNTKGCMHWLLLGTILLLMEEETHIFVFLLLHFDNFSQYIFDFCKDPMDKY